MLVLAPVANAAQLYFFVRMLPAQGCHHGKPNVTKTQVLKSRRQEEFRGEPQEIA